MSKDGAIRPLGVSDVGESEHDGYGGRCASGLYFDPHLQPAANGEVAGCFQAGRSVESARIRR